MLLLGFDTATPAVTVALHDGARVLAEVTSRDARQAERLAPSIAEVLAAAGADRRDLSAIAVGVGPGPFTGLRVGVVTARVLGAALGIPVYGVCTLDIIASDVTLADSVPFLVVTDARRREVYWAGYDGAGRRHDGPFVGPPASVPDGGRMAAGEGPVLYPRIFLKRIGPVFPAASALCRVVAASAVALLEPEPLYLRRPDAREPGAPKRVTERR